MAHLSEDSQRLTIREMHIEAIQQLETSVCDFPDVCFIRLPISQHDGQSGHLNNIQAIADLVGRNLRAGSTLIVYGDVIDLVHSHDILAQYLRYQLWIAVKCLPLTMNLNNSLPHHHLGALVYTKYDKQLQHNKTRLSYTYCPACNKTTKDYGGKKHTYHPYGTLISDVWRDITVEASGNIDTLYERFADVFGLAQYSELRVLNLTSFGTDRVPISRHLIKLDSPPATLESQLINGDCLEELRKMPDDVVDFAFADPPYNLKKQYRGYDDDLDIAEYFSWCDEWITEVARVLRPGGTFALLNIPLWSIRHFLHLESVLEYQNWIVWDALSFPVRMIMPAHYSILCFSKGTPRTLPGFTGEAGDTIINNGLSTHKALTPLKQNYCLRASCVNTRRYRGIDDRDTLSDMWWDIHRLKHNSRRVDHPCQLPPQLMYRLIALFTKPNEIVLDCFNGAGTTTLAAHQLGRRYIGIEREPQYHVIASQRHIEIEHGLDPFRKVKRQLTAKNSPVARLKQQKYDIPKKTLQLEVRRVAQLLGKLPSRDEMIEHGEYSIRYYDEYFTSWGEVCAAARNEGMTEVRDTDSPKPICSQKRLF